MLRSMDMTRALLFVLAGVLAGCGTQAGAVEASDVPEQVRTRLLAEADSAAEGNGGQASRVEAVQTTRRQAERLAGSESNQPDVPVWVVQVSGDDYSCDACSRPLGAEAPVGDYLTLVLTTETYDGTSFGISPRPAELASVGEVEVLRE
jgi:hypothetical protein